MRSSALQHRFVSTPILSPLSAVVLVVGLALGAPPPHAAMPGSDAPRPLAEQPTDDEVRSRFEHLDGVDRRVLLLGGSGSPRTSGDPGASGDLLGALGAILELGPAVPGASEAPGAVLVAGSAVTSLAADEGDLLAAAFAGGAPVLLIDPTAEEIRSLQERLGTGRQTVLPDGVDRVVAYGLRGETDRLAGSSFTLYRLEPTEGAPTGPESESPDALTLAEIQAATVAEWLLVSPEPAEPVASSSGPREAGDEPADLTRLTKAWMDVASWSTTIGNYQLTFFAWPAHSKVQGRDYFYLQAQGIFNPAKLYTVESGWADYWSRRLVWEKGDHHCGGDFPRACLRKGYITQYGLNAQPRGLEGDRYLAQLIESSPKTSQGHSTWTTGISWSLGGQVTAGYGTGTVTVSGGVTVSNQRTVTVPDVRVENTSLRTDNNSAASYRMPLLKEVPGERCVNRLDEPRAAQIRTFQPRNDTVWSTAPELRSSQQSFVVDVELTVEAGDSVLKSFPASGNPPGDCNLFTCDCRVSPSSHIWFTPRHALSIPFPGQK